MLADHSLKNAKRFVPDKSAYRPIDGPIIHKVITTHSKPAVIIAKPLSQYFGFAQNWDSVSFAVSIVEGGLYFALVPKTKEYETEGRAAAAPLPSAYPSNGRVTRLEKTARALSIIQKDQQRKPQFSTENGSSCNTTALEKGAK